MIIHYVHLTLGGTKKGLITRYSVWAVQEVKMRLKIATLIFFCFKQLEWKSEK